MSQLAFDRDCSGRRAPAALGAEWSRRGYWSGETVAGVLDKAAANWSDRHALVLGAHRLTFRELATRAALLAGILARHGLRAGDRIVMQLPNTVESVLLLFAAWRLGAVPVPIVPLYRERELRTILAQVRPAAVVFAAQRGGRRPALEAEPALNAAGVQPVAKYVVGGEEPGWQPFPETALTPSPGLCAPDHGREPQDCSLILFTSGTTAEPKGVQHDSLSLFAEARSYRDGARLSAHDVVFLPAPLAHIGAVVAATLLPCLIGARVVVMPSWDPEQAIRVVTDEHVTFAIGAPVFLSELVERYEREPSIAHRVRKFQTGAAPVTRSLLARAQAVGIVAWRAWGMTEAPSISYGGPDAPLDKRAGTDGRVELFSQVCAVDANRTPLPPGAVGELRVRSPKQMVGYTDPRLTWAQVDEDGWFYTGDLGTVDEDGWVTITGRLKDIINRGGEKFSAAEIEQVICGHHTIGAAAVVGVAEPRLGEQVVAFVTVRPGCAYPGDEVMRAYLAECGLARQKTPVAWIVLDGLPVTPTGKIQKHVLVQHWSRLHGGDPE